MKSVLLAAALPVLALGSCVYSFNYYTKDRCDGVYCDVNSDCSSYYCNYYYSSC